MNASSSKADSSASPILTPESQHALTRCFQSLGDSAVMLGRGGAGGGGGGGGGGEKLAEKQCSVRFFRGARLAVEKGLPSETLWDVAARAASKPGQSWLTNGAEEVSIKFLEEESCGKQGELWGPLSIHAAYRVSVEYAKQATLSDFDEDIYGSLRVWVLPVDDSHE